MGNVDCVHLFVGHGDALRIGVGIEFAVHRYASVGRRGADQIDDDAVADRRLCPPVLADVREQAMLSGRRGEFPPRALPAPCVNLPLHTAPDVPPLKSNGEPLCLTHRAPPVTGWPRVLAEQGSPFGPVPLQNLQPYYGPLSPCAPHRYSGSLGFRRLDFCLGIGTTGSHVPHKRLARPRAACMPDAARAGFRANPN